MHQRPVNARSLALISFLLALPFASLLLLLVLHIEPPFARWLATPPNGPNIAGTAVILGAWLLSLAGFIINLAPLMRSIRSGGGLAALPLNLILAAAILFFLLYFVGAIIVDQYPCWIGVPNCD